MSTQTLVDPEKLKNLSGPELVNLYNELNPESPVKRFSDRKSGIKRILNLMISEKPIAEPPQPEELPAPESIPASNQESHDHGVETCKNQFGFEPPARKLLYPVRPHISQHRPNSRRGLMLRMMQRPQGAKRGELSEATDWPLEELEINLRLIHVFLGHGIEEGAAGDLHLLGKPVGRKPFSFPRKGEVKKHRPGTKRALTFDLLSRPEGATLDEVRGATGWNVPQAVQGINLLHTYLGYGLSEDEDGNIKIF